MSWTLSLLRETYIQTVVGAGVWLMMHFQREEELPMLKYFRELPCPVPLRGDYRMSIVLWSKPKIWLLVFVTLMYLPSTASPPRIPMHCDNPLHPQLPTEWGGGKEMVCSMSNFSSSLFNVLPPEQRTTDN